MFKPTENLEDVNPEMVLEILHELDTGFKFYKSESFFGLTQQSDDFVSKCNLSIKYGIVESIFWVKDLKNENQFGGPLSRITKQIQFTDGIENIERIQYPSFNSYEQLNQIVLELYNMFCDFKEVVQQGNEDETEE
jgi:hypothetical protein